MFFALQGFTKEFMVLLKDNHGAGVEYLGTTFNSLKIRMYIF
jgi:hypothetical protein